MSAGVTAPAELPPPGLVDLDPAWSRLVAAPDHTGADRTWHLLDNQVPDPRLTVLCVHGNPSWSFLWRKVLQQAPSDVRVIAVDQLEMGFSERTGTVRRLGDRIADLIALTDHLDLSGSVVTVAHDWGGPVSLGWAEDRHRRHPGDLAGIVLTNTAVHQPEGSPAPAVIRATRTRGVLRQVTVNTTAFIRGAIEMSRPRLAAEVRTGLLAPYLTAGRREAIADFVEDIPLDDGHPSFAVLDDVADGLAALGDIPALLLWGPADPVFSDLYLHDLERRLPQAEVHRFIGASHFVQEDAEVAEALFAWLGRPGEADPAPPSARPPLWAALDDLADNTDPAVVELHDGETTSITFSQLHDRVMALAAGLADEGVRPGHRVAIMIPPGIDLSVVLYACWRMGAVAVVVDSGLGPRNMSRALSSAAPDHLVGVRRALLAARVLRWPGLRLGVDDLPRIEQRGLARPVPAAPSDDAPAAVVFTSGSTGPSKGVVYRHRQLQAQRDQLADLYQITPADRLVAAFAPFALYGPALGITSAVPDMDVTRPATLGADALGAAAAAIDATLVFASPAALTNVVATASSLPESQRRALEGVRLLLSAGAPVGAGLLARAGRLLPNAEPHTPYGMTEVLPVADITLAELDSRGDGDGVCVGRPRAGVAVRIDPANDEVLIQADHVKDHYDRLWFTDHKASLPRGWHRSGDVGAIDDDGYLWIGGRLEHVITTAACRVMPVTVEQAAETATDVVRAAAVGIGPVGAQVVAVVVEVAGGGRRPRLADAALADRIRAAVGDRADIAAVLVVPELPVDRRHNSKIDRTRVATWAAKVLAGGRIGRL